ncbi:unnamed protein product [Heligmosomoides polygyrus]|uniref:Secreted protein n=1 Tax=Heligmosomoides polygyrus TaxID=6339 RepID=A0A183FUK6_HELPZ|nr:unnamed protein product [Heligmosomoides polygyrus]
MKSFAVLCAFALLGICLALGANCNGKDQIFEGLSKAEIAMMCEDDDQSEGRQERVARYEATIKCYISRPTTRETTSAALAGKKNPNWTTSTRSRMKSFAVLCPFALLAICLALGANCNGKDPKIFKKFQKWELELMCGNDDQSEGKQGRVARSISSGLKSAAIIQAQGVKRSGRIRRDVKISPVIVGKVPETGERDPQDTEKAIITSLPRRRLPKLMPRKHKEAWGDTRPIMEYENA